MSEKDIWDLIDKNLDKLEVLIQEGKKVEAIVADEATSPDELEEAKARLATITTKKEGLTDALDGLREKLPEVAAE